MKVLNIITAVACLAVCMAENYMAVFFVLFVYLIVREFIEAVAEKKEDENTYKERRRY